MKTKLSIILALLVCLLAFAPSASADLPDCPTIADTDSLSVGDTLTGYTVVEGDTVESFSVEILGLQENAFLPGHTIVIGRASGAPVDLAGGGIAAGMSGSPVYTSGGELVGAIAYGFSASPSPITGITPASDMAEQLPPAPLPLSRSVKRSIALATGKAAPGALKQIPLVFSSSSGSISPRMAKYLERNNIVFAGRSSGSSRKSTARLSPLSVPEFHAADTLTAYFSTGDTAVGGLGTATYVCDGQFLGFGHPMLDSGTDEPIAFAGKGDVYGYVVDETLGPYKYGVFGEAVGSVSSDSPWAIGGSLGQLPPSYSVDISVANTDTETSQQTQTEVVSMPPVADKAWIEPYAISNAVYGTMKSESGSGSWGGGSAAVDITIAGTSRRGPWEIDYRDHIDSPMTLSACPMGCNLNAGIATEMLAGGALSWAAKYPGLDIEATSVDVSVASSEQRSFYNIIRARWSLDSKNWRAGTALVKRGQVFFVRLDMRNPSGNITSRTFRARASKSGRAYISFASASSTGQIMDPYWGMPEDFYKENSFAGAIDYINNMPRLDKLIVSPSGLSVISGNTSFDATLYGKAGLEARVR